MKTFLMLLVIYPSFAYAKSVTLNCENKISGDDVSLSITQSDYSDGSSGVWATLHVDSQDPARWIDGETSSLSLTTSPAKPFDYSLKGTGDDKSLITLSTNAGSTALNIIAPISFNGASDSVSFQGTLNSAQTQLVGTMTSGTQTVKDASLNCAQSIGY